MTEHIEDKSRGSVQEYARNGLPVEYLGADGSDLLEYLGADVLGFLGRPLLLPLHCWLHRVRAAIDQLRTSEPPGQQEKVWELRALETAWCEQVFLKLKISGGSKVSMPPPPCVRM